jgi:hypothetical protein
MILRMNLRTAVKDAAITTRAAAEDTSTGIKTLVVIGAIALVVGLLILATDRQILNAVRG